MNNKKVELEQLRSINGQQQQNYYSPENGLQQLSLDNDENNNSRNIENDNVNRIQLSERASFQAKINELQEKLNTFEEQNSVQTDDIGRLQRENGILNEKFENEKRKVSLLESLEGQMQILMDDKCRLENEYLKLNNDYKQNVQEQNDLLVLCSTYEDQLTTCRNIIKNAGLSMPTFLLDLDTDDITR